MVTEKPEFLQKRGNLGEDEMMEIRLNHWAKITDNHWVHPDLGYLKFQWEQWEAHPKAELGVDKSFDDFKKATAYMESLQILKLSGRK